MLKYYHCPVWNLEVPWLPKAWTLRFLQVLHKLFHWKKQGTCRGRDHMSQCQSGAIFSYFQAGKPFGVAVALLLMFGDRETNIQKDLRESRSIVCPNPPPPAPPRPAHFSLSDLQRNSNPAQRKLLSDTWGSLGHPGSHGLWTNLQNSRLSDMVRKAVSWVLQNK